MHVVLFHIPLLWMFLFKGIVLQIDLSISARVLSFIIYPYEYRCSCVREDFYSSSSSILSLEVASLMFGCFSYMCHCICGSSYVHDLAVGSYLVGSHSMKMSRM